MHQEAEVLFRMLPFETCEFPIKVILYSDVL